MNDIVQRYIKLFRGRGDVYGDFNSPRAIREPLTPEHFEHHLTSTNPKDWIGVYPHLGSRGVTWGCVDIDGKDFPAKHTPIGEDWQWDWDAMWALATKLQKVLAVKSVFAHIERTRNGYHLWVFPEAGIVPAATMRRALMAACKVCDYDPKEVNPKQEDLLPGKVGNWVRLPYYGALSDRGHQPDRYFVGTVGGEWSMNSKLGLYEFVDSVKLTTTDALASIAALWTPPVRVTFDGPPPDDLVNLLATLDGLTFTIWRDGPLEGRDRSNTLAKLAYNLRDHQVPMPSAFAVVKNADERWGKFADRPDCDEQIMGILERAYSA